jgi:alkylated DNA repair protein (DNA oxidative demethylase)
MTVLEIKGVRVYPEYLMREAQEALVADIRQVAENAPFFTPVTARGKAMSVRMTSAGRVGWVSDRREAQEARHPAGMVWPAIPESVLGIWRDLVSKEREPDCCLVNWYGDGARMGLHQDRDEGDFSWPVLSVSLGDDALFRVGGVERSDPTESVWLRSGDVVVMGGDARLCHHGIDRVKHGSSMLLPKAGRINLTCRVVA